MILYEIYMKFEKLEKLRCENVKISRMIVIFIELFNVLLFIKGLITCYIKDASDNIHREVSKY